MCPSSDGNHGVSVGASLCVPMLPHPCIPTSLHSHVSASPYPCIYVSPSHRCIPPSPCSLTSPQHSSLYLSVNDVLCDGGGAPFLLVFNGLSQHNCFLNDSILSLTLFSSLHFFVYVLEIHSGLLSFVSFQWL